MDTARDLHLLWGGLPQRIVVRVRTKCRGDCSDRGQRLAAPKAIPFATRPIPSDSFSRLKGSLSVAFWFRDLHSAQAVPAPNQEYCAQPSRTAYSLHLQTTKGATQLKPRLTSERERQLSTTFHSHTISTRLPPSSCNDAIRTPAPASSSIPREVHL